MVDYSITITDHDGDTISFTHNFDASNTIMVEASGLVVSDEATKVKTIMVILKKADIRALLRFLNMAYTDMALNNTEEESDDD